MNKEKKVERKKKEKSSKTLSLSLCPLFLILSLLELQQHVVVRGQAAARPQHVLEGRPLRRQGVDDGGPLGH